MNKEKILAVADAIERHAIDDLGFNMTTYLADDSLYEDTSGHNCGTVGCIAGWANALEYGVKGMLEFAHPDFFLKGAMILDLDQRTATLLFTPSPLRFDNIKATEAVRVMRRLVETGEVDWSEVVERQRRELGEFPECGLKLMDPREFHDTLGLD